MNVKAFLLCLPLLAVAAPAWADIEIDRPWSRATAPGARVAAGYMVLRNTSAVPDRLLSASSPVAARVETHMTLKDGEVMRMREVKGYAIPANGRFELKPGGAHLMLVDIRAPLKEGESVPLVLRFERAGEKRITLQVSRSGPPAAHGHSGH